MFMVGRRALGIECIRGFGFLSSTGFVGLLMLVDEGYRVLSYQGM